MARYKVVKFADVAVMKTVTTAKGRGEQKEGLMVHKHNI